jgi:hypothetical protein
MERKDNQVPSSKGFGWVDCFFGAHAGAKKRLMSDQRLSYFARVLPNVVDHLHDDHYRVDFTL